MFFFIEICFSLLKSVELKPVNLAQMQELYGAPGYFSEAETERKRPS